jgi:two-component system response regulator MprA
MKKKTIFIIDDDPDILLTLKLALEQEDYRVETAENVVDMLEKSSRTPPDVILLDVMLPWLSGYSSCDALKSRFDNCPVIMISALSQRQDIERGMWSGADEYLTKPLDLDFLFERIRDLTARPADSP